MGPLGPDLGRFFWSTYWARHAGLLADWEDKISPGLVACMRAGADVKAIDYLHMRERKLAYVAGISSFLEDWDYLITPVASVAAFPVERVRPEHWPNIHGTGLHGLSSSIPSTCQPILRPAFLRYNRRGAPCRIADRKPALQRPRCLASRAAFEEAMPMQRQLSPIALAS